MSINWVKVQVHYNRLRLPADTLPSRIEDLAAANIAELSSGSRSRRGLKSALYLRVKKRKTFFFGKKAWNFENYFSFEKCRIVPKNVKGGTLLDLLTYIMLQNIKKLEGGPFWDIKKIFEKKPHSAEKNPKGDPLDTSGFVGFLEKVKNERGTLWTKFALAGLGLRWFQECFQKVDRSMWGM